MNLQISFGMVAVACTFLIASSIQVQIANAQNTSTSNEELEATVQWLNEFGQLNSRKPWTIETKFAPCINSHRLIIPFF